MHVKLPLAAHLTHNRPAIYVRCFFFRLGKAKPPLRPSGVPGKLLYCVIWVPPPIPSFFPPPPPSLDPSLSPPRTPLSLFG